MTNLLIIWFLWVTGIQIADKIKKERFGQKKPNSVRCLFEIKN